MKQRLLPADRKKLIFQAALTVAEHSGFHNLTREAVAIEARVSRTLVNRYFENIDKLRAAVMRHAIRNDLLRVVAQGLVVNDPVARRAPKAVKQAAYKALNA